ncbi:Regulatory protein AfsR [Actinomadura rubteroloni]|uniref:Regulatory protein AfsR n=1 Tax=Actinomadura rubteroloni TaxID=1926885 RepID=A0A2P4UFN1_9ACTN|nr:Regulatory protein AfsR [Actinomadura rubteroloni]
MRYEILGSLRVADGEVTITAPKIEVVLATLLIRSGEVVSVDQLVTEVWGGEPPQRATAALYVYVSQLRKLLPRDENGARPIETRSPGYVLHADEGQLDLHLFQRLVRESRAHVRAGRWDEARVGLEDALGLARGSALATLPGGPVINGFARWVNEVRLECQETLGEMKLRLGRHREMVGVLSGLIREYPLHEPFYGQLMLALYRCDRRADALGVYQTARETLNRELGLDPGRGLREMQRSILAADEVLDARPAV